MELHLKDVFKTASGRDYTFEAMLRTAARGVSYEDVGTVEFCSESGGHMVMHGLSYTIHRDLWVAKSDSPSNRLAWTYGPRIRSVPGPSEWLICTGDTSIRVKCGWFGIGDVSYGEGLLRFYFNGRTKIADVVNITDPVVSSVIAILVAVRGALVAWD